MVRGQSTLHQMLIVSGHDWVGNIHTETINIVSNHILSDLNLATFGWTMTRVAGWAGMGGFRTTPRRKGAHNFRAKIWTYTFFIQTVGQIKFEIESLNTGWP